MLELGISTHTSYAITWKLGGQRRLLGCIGNRSKAMTEAERLHKRYPNSGIRVEKWTRRWIATVSKVFVQGKQTRR